MSYTPTTWTTGDTISASAMNKIEQGIANAGGSSGFFVVTARNFPAESNWVGAFKYIVYDDGSYEEATLAGSLNTSLYVYGNNTRVWFTPMSIPALENYYLAFSPASGVTVASVSGEIDEDPVSVGGFNHYIIHGDFTMTLEGWD